MIVSPKFLIVVWVIAVNIGTTAVGYMFFIESAENTIVAIRLVDALMNALTPEQLAALEVMD